jgi:hypothetical protein
LVDFLQIESSGTFTTLIDYLTGEERAEREARELVAKEKVRAAIGPFPAIFDANAFSVYSSCI